MKTNRSSAFTLLELLTVIGIIGILAAIMVPNLAAFKPNVMAAGTRQLLDDVARARQLALIHRTTVYMVFVPAGFWNDPAYAALAPEFRAAGDPLRDKQLVAYNYVTLRSLGDQPGRPTVRYLSDWRTLPEGIVIAPEKFLPRGPAPNALVSASPDVVFPVYGFEITRDVPFPRPETPMASPPALKYTALPHIAFNYMGQLVSGTDEVIPLALGRTELGAGGVRSIAETPPGNGTTLCNLVTIDWLTGRGRIQQREIP